MSYYLERGHTLDELCNLSRFEKLFMKASAIYQLETKAEMYKGLQK